MILNFPVDDFHAVRLRQAQFAAQRRIARIMQMIRQRRGVCAWRDLKHLRLDRQQRFAARQPKLRHLLVRHGRQQEILRLWRKIQLRFAVAKMQQPFFAKHVERLNRRGICAISDRQAQRGVLMAERRPSDKQRIALAL